MAGITVNYTFDTITDYYYDNTLIEISAGSAKLKDLGGGTYSTANPKLMPNFLMKVDTLTNFVETSTKVGSDEIKYTIEVAGLEKYWDGIAWSNSNGTYSQANTAAIILANISSLSLTDGFKIRPVKYLHSDAGTSTPTLSNLQLTVNYAAPAINPTKVIVEGYIYKSNTIPDPDGILYITVSEIVESTANNLTIPFERIQIYPNQNGYWEADLIPSVNISELEYIFEFAPSDGKTDIIRKKVSDLNGTGRVEFKDL
jgi:hypothetical protein